MLSDEWLSRYRLLENFNASVTRTGTCTRTGTGTWTTGVTAIALCTSCSRAKKYDILHKSQSGFRKNHSCNTALLGLLDKWLKNIDKGEITGAVFFDLRKAFDVVDHEILLQKLKSHKFDDR